MVASADVVDLHSDRVPTRRYDLDELHTRVEAERDLSLQKRGQELRAGRPGAQWFAGVQGRQVGPLSVAGLAGLRARGQLTAVSLVWHEGWPGWVAIEAVDELRAVVGLPVLQRETDPGPQVPESLRGHEGHTVPGAALPEVPLEAEARPPPPPPLEHAEAAALASLADEILEPARPAARPPPLTALSIEPGSPVLPASVSPPPESAPFETSPVRSAAQPQLDQAPVLELSTPPRARKSRGPSQQTWFADEQPRAELPGRKVVIGIAIVLALVAIGLLLRGGVGH